VRTVARFQPGPGLNARVAARFAVPAVRHIADQLAERMRANAPDARAWITAQDERVRPTHRDADGQTIPANLRYAIDKPTGGAELARAPRDQNLSPANRLNCRCIDVLLPGAVADTVSVSDVTLRRSAASATVSVHFPRIVESEHPDASDGGGGWVARSITEAAGGAGRSN
jgi:hypothetical protein